MEQEEVGTLRNQLKIARNEINKLRQHVNNLQHVQRKDIERLNRMLQEFRCEGCKERQIEENNRNQNVIQKINPVPNGGHRFGPVGVLRTAFAEKRALPRQASVGGRLRGVIELNADVFTNPEHSLDGLAEFSHLWIIYHFHKNTAHPKAKVSPPRLCGERRVGVFATRSPHRPCPIGLSLVEIDKIEGATISFFGTDMIDGTPVLDIKPYIPHYDAPNGVLDVSGRVSTGPSDAVDFYNLRQEPDGEESELELMGAGGQTNLPSGGATASANGGISQTRDTAVKVPNWVVANHKLNVCFNERAEAQLRELPEVPRQCIIDILEADPRSVYLRTKYSSQIFTFQLSEVTVTCKFDDRADTVTVVQIRRTENLHDDNVA